MGIGHELQEYYKKLVEKSDELERAIDEAANSWLARTLDLDEEIRTAGAAVLSMLRNQILPSLKKIADTVSMSDVLRDHKKGWQTIDSGAGAISTRLENEVSGIRAQYHWEGAAARAYGDSVKGQEKQVTGLSTASQAIQGSLDAVASALDVGGYTILPGITAFIVSLAGTILSAATVVGFLEALAFLLTAAAAFLASLGSIIAGFVLVNTAQSDQAEAVGRTLSALDVWQPPNVGDFGVGGDWRAL